MRDLVREISSYARRFNRNFIVLAVDGLNLLEKIDPVDATRYAPATTYMRSVNGIIIRGLNMRTPLPGKTEIRTDVKVRNELVRLADVGKRSGLKVWVADFAKTAQLAQESFKLNNDRGYVPFAVDNAEFRHNSIPHIPPRPFNENPSNVTGLKQVKNFLFMTDSSAYENQDDFVVALNDTNYDAIVIDVFHQGRTPFSPKHVRGMKFKKLGARRLILAHVNVGYADSSRYYWKPEWREGNPPFIRSSALGNPDVHFVQYWDAGWKNIITGNTKSYIYGIVAQGYDGVVIDGIDTYQYFEGTIR
ncbi:MAG: hypothetical protein HQ503_11120 [Rhodospirillales bacterium]|nr:hypothetical protein [Rhodospirillales bacterium]